MQSGIGAGDRAGTVLRVNDQVDTFSQLAAIVGEGHVLTSDGDLAPYTVDWTGRYRGTGRIVVRPGSTDEVADVVRLCRRSGAAIVPQGGNTGLVGGSVALQGEVVVSTRRLNLIGDVDRSTRQITVGAGVTLGEVRTAAERAGLCYPVDFAARDSATIGGSIATNAGGISVLRYGMTRRHVVGIEAVLGSGDVVSHLGGLIKDNTGFDLAGLLCGSEGTLGIVTAARLQLVPIHTNRTTVLIGFDSVTAAMFAVDRLCSSSDEFDAVEIFFESGARLVNETFDRSLPFDAPCFLLIEMSSNIDRTEWLAGELERVPHVVDVAVALNDAMRTNIWRLREEHTPAINTLGPPLKFDVTVPVGDLPDFSEAVHRSVHEVTSEASTYLFGHAADGNLHVNVTGIDPDTQLARVVEEAVMATVVAFHGSVSAEHGIGSAKKRFLSMSRSSAEIDAMRAIKRALDPDGIMNPNVLFD